MKADADLIGVPLRVVIFGMASSPRYPDAEPVPQTVLVNPVITPLGDEMEDGAGGENGAAPGEIHGRGAPLAEETIGRQLPPKSEEQPADCDAEIECHGLLPEDIEEYDYMSEDEDI